MPKVINQLFPAKSVNKSQFLDWGRGGGNGGERQHFHLSERQNNPYHKHYVIQVS